MKFQNCNNFCNGHTHGMTDGQAQSNMPLQLVKKVWGIKIISPNSCYQSNQMIIPSAISQERLISKANYLLPEKKNMNSYVGDILLFGADPVGVGFHFRTLLSEPVD